MGDSLLFKDYVETGLVYHVVPIVKLDDILKDGLKVGESSNKKYEEFNSFFDRFKPSSLPSWVSRRNAIYASLNFKMHNNWHSHSALLSFPINEDKCWVGNENKANILFEPFILGKTGLFESARKLIINQGEEMVQDYWKSSLSFKENLKIRLDKRPNYDAEVLVFHDISPQSINIVKIISDHRFMDISEWDTAFKELCRKGTES